MSVYRIYYVPVTEYLPGRRKLVRLVFPEQMYFEPEGATNYIDLPQAKPENVPLTRDIIRRWTHRDVNGHPKHYVNALGNIAYDTDWIWEMEEDDA